MAINFPSSPTSGDTYVYGDFTYAYDGEKWTSQGTFDEEYVKTSGDTVTGDLTLKSQGGTSMTMAGNPGESMINFYDEAGVRVSKWAIDPTGHYSILKIDEAGSASSVLFKTYPETNEVGMTAPFLFGAQGTRPESLTRKDYVDSSIPTRKKSEVHYTGLNVVLTAGVATNIITALNGLPVSSGTWLPMFDSTTGKLTPFNDDRSVTFKLNLMGTFDGGSTNRALQLDFTGTVGNRIVVMRDSNITPSPNSIQFATFFSVDKDGNMATNGTEPMVTALGGNFTITEALIIAEQVTTEG